MNVPATVGTAQWILGVKAVQPNLEVGRLVNFIVFEDVKLVDYPPENANRKYRPSKKSRDQTPFRDSHVLVSC